MIKLNAILLFFIILTILGCHETNQPDKIKIQLKYQITPEDDNHYYLIEWIDTLGQSEGFSSDRITKRTKEIWCFITDNQKDTLGYYKGLSTPQTFCYFQSKDSVITLNFMIGQNMFPNKFEKDTLSFKNYNKTNKKPIEFNPIEVNILTELRKEIKVELYEK